MNKNIEKISSLQEYLQDLEQRETNDCYLREKQIVKEHLSENLVIVYYKDGSVALSTHNGNGDYNTVELIEDDLETQLNRIVDNPESGKISFERAKQKAFSYGTAITYRNEQGQAVKEYPDGKIVELLDLEGKSQFLEGKIIRKARNV